MIFTVDVESDWGGRSDTIQGIREGIPVLLKLFSDFKVKAYFFLSTQYLDKYVNLAKRIKDDGHIIGSHGHEHRKFKGWKEWSYDFSISEHLILKHLGLRVNYSLYRAPWFSHQLSYQKFTNPENHVSVLKSAWFPFQSGDILYVHPFDIVKPKTKAPNLFCKILYSRPKKVYAKLCKFLTEKNQ